MIRCKVQPDNRLFLNVHSCSNDSATPPTGDGFRRRREPRSGSANVPSWPTYWSGSRPSLHRLAKPVPSPLPRVGPYDPTSKLLSTLASLPGARREGVAGRARRSNPARTGRSIVRISTSAITEVNRAESAERCREAGRLVEAGWARADVALYDGPRWIKPSPSPPTCSPSSPRRRHTSRGC